MKATTLLIMAAGLGTRFGSEEVKQLTPVGPNGELIIDYSIRDAVEAGFNKIVIVIREEIEKEVHETIGARAGNWIRGEKPGCQIQYAFQKADDLPVGYELPEGRTKPWGTGQAVLAARELIKDPFCVINADDYYGKEAFVKIHDFLIDHCATERQYCMAGFILKNTLSKNGSVTRAICSVDNVNQLLGVKETYQIMALGTGESVVTASGEKLGADSFVSMNMWGFTPDYMKFLKGGFTDFLDHMSDPLNDEFLLPEHMDRLIRSGKVSVKMLPSRDKWFGVTYAEDKETVKEEFQKLIESGVYCDKLY